MGSSGVSCDTSCGTARAEGEGGKMDESKGEEVERTDGEEDGDVHFP